MTHFFGATIYPPYDEYRATHGCFSNQRSAGKNEKRDKKSICEKKLIMFWLRPQITVLHVQKQCIPTGEKATYRRWTTFFRYERYQYCVKALSRSSLNMPSELFKNISKVWKSAFFCVSVEGAWAGPYIPERCSCSD